MLRLCLPALALVPAVFAQIPDLPAHETLSYNVEWRLITAGKATLDWRRNAGGAAIDVRLESVGLVSKLFRVDDSYQSQVGPGLCTQSSEFLSHEGSRERETRINYDGAAHRAFYVERDRLRNTVLLQKEIEIPSCVHDVAGGLYFLRTVRLEPGQSTTIPVSDGKKFAMAKVEAQQREDIRTPEGVFHTIRYEAYLFNNVLFQRPAHLYIWFTDDRLRLPVQIRVRMQITIGTITLQLEKHVE
jgi:hypothetical protein